MMEQFLSRYKLIILMKQLVRILRCKYTSQANKRRVEQALTDKSYMSNTEPSKNRYLTILINKSSICCHLLSLRSRMQRRNTCIGCSNSSLSRTLFLCGNRKLIPLKLTRLSIPEVFSFNSNILRKTGQVDMNSLSVY